MARTTRRYAWNVCKRHSRLGCDYGVTGRCKRPWRRALRRTERTEIVDQLEE